MSSNKDLFARRQRRTRFKLRQTAGGKPRLSVFRSARHIYAQLIDDSKGVTLASASTAEKELDVAKSWNKDAAAEVGKRVAERALKAGVTEIVFDRGGYIFHGRVKSLADAAREAGLKF
ncbi:MAG: 50S ribosomal protein L18 [Micropepsaceae bacterium]